MGTKQQILKRTFENSFEMNRYVRFIKEFFSTGIEIVRPDRKNKHYLSEYAFYIKTHTHVANYTDPQQNKLAIFAVELHSGRNIERARSMQRNFVSKLISDTKHDGALVAFYNENMPVWRLSLVLIDLDFAKGKVKTTLSPARRFSYLVGENEPCHTAMEQLFLIVISENPTIEQIKEAFSVEAVTNEFFEKYKEKYLQLKEGLEASQPFNVEAAKCHFTSEQFAKKFLGQLVFIYFLQKKGWLGVKVVPQKLNEREFKNAFYNRNKAARNIIPRMYTKTGKEEYRLRTDRLGEISNEEADVMAGCFKPEPWGSGTRIFIRELFDNCLKNNRNFFHDYLEPLFYEALNCKRGENQYYKKFNCKIPFLNGGLFEPIKGYDWGHSNFRVSNELFSNRHIKGEKNADGIMDVFERYNFTMNEDEPLEKEVAVDPEMLGKIFENLLEVKDRKSKGAFYTPREIVHYMCQESLINYLVTETNVPYEDMKNFIIYGEIMKDEDYSRRTKQGKQELRIPQSIYNNLKKIDEALANVKIADPAVGSGAFPLGMLGEIAKARNNITYYFAQEETSGLDRKILFEITRSPYNIKWETIKNSIFAVDIEASAVDIAKLRLWLSLVVDQEVTNNNDDIFFTKENDNPKPLPNLDYNIMCGDSLIDEFEGIKLFDDSLLANEPVYGESGQTDETSKTDWQISLFHDQIEVLTMELFKEQDRFFDEEDNEKKLQIKNRIDALIDNIIRARLSKDGNTEGIAKYEESLKQDSKPYFLWKLEFARVFKEKGGFDIIIGNPPYVQLSRKKDVSVKYKNFLRYRYKTSGGRLNLFIFMMHLGIEILNRKGTLAYIIPNTLLTQDYYKDTRELLLKSCTIKAIVDYQDMPFDKAVVENITIIYSNYPSNDYKINIFRGTTESVYKWKQIPVKQFKNARSKSFSINSNALIERMFDGSVSLSTMCNINQAIALKGNKSLSLHNEYKKGYYKLLDGRNINKYGINWGGVFLDYDLERIHSCKRKDIFECEEKLLFRRVSSNLIFAYDNEQHYALNTIVVVTLKNKEEHNIKYLLALLNSKLMNYIYANKFKSTKKVFSEIQARSVGELPIKLSPTISQYIEAVDSILEKRNNNIRSDISDLELKIDKMVYDLYGLTSKEIEIVENM
jgi:adenine-specific DNA-methyltransferase